MLLRASGELSGTEVDVRAIVDTGAAAGSGVMHAEMLIAFTDALVGDDDVALGTARARLLETVGPERLVDAAAVVSNFERMVRVADATGIPLDGAVDVMSQDLQDELRLKRFAAAANTHTSAAQRLLGEVLRPAAHGALRLIGKLGWAR